MNINHRRTMRSFPRVRGLSLIELMIALVLGLLVVLAAIGIFTANRATYRATESLGRVQENARTAFELMARDLREAGGNPCVHGLPIVNVLNGSAANWWTNLNTWGNSVRGFDDTQAFPNAGFGTGAGNRLTGTDAVQLLSGDDSVATISSHNTAGSQFTLNTSTHGFSSGDLLMACNSRQASVFQASTVSSNTVSHAAGGTSPGNCTAGLGLPAGCSGAVFEFSAPNSVMVRLHATRWYIANNGRGTRSLYQIRLAGGNASNPEEVAEGVQDMRLTYLMRDGTTYLTATQVDASAKGWADVIAVRVELTLEGPERTGGQPITREMIHVASLRNRNA